MDFVQLKITHIMLRMKLVKTHHVKIKNIKLQDMLILKQKTLKIYYKLYKPDLFQLQLMLQTGLHIALESSITVELDLIMESYLLDLKKMLGSLKTHGELDGVKKVS